MNLNRFMKGGIDRIMKTAGRFYLRNREGRAFLTEMAPQMARSARQRESHESEGTHVPAFLIASVASRCNLHCAGCYARAGGACGGEQQQPDMTAAEWARIFAEAAGLGVSFVLLAGGEPLLRRDVLQAAAGTKEMMFPVFTNGTLLDEEYLQLFAANRNLVPVISVEGGEVETDTRRGVGTFAKIETAMARLAAQGLLFGVSVTVSRENMDEVLTRGFLQGLHEKGCGIAIYVEYVPVEAGTEHLALGAAELTRLNRDTVALKREMGDMVVLSFPGDEEAMGGCLASGRGFFHINATGGAEPCPFSPYARYSLRDTPMEQVLCSDYFVALQKIAAEAGPHTGGCVLFQRQEEVKALLAR